MPLEIDYNIYEGERMDEKNPWKKLDSKIAYKGKYLNLREDKVIRPDGKKGIYNYLELGSSVYIVAVNDKSEICLVGQYRYPTDMFSWEVPGGNANGEDLLAAAKRELQEETGLIAENWEELGWFQEVSGVSDGIGNIFVARNLSETTKHKKLEDGITKMEWATTGQLLKLVSAGLISDAMTMAVLAMVLVKFGGKL